MNKMSMRPLLNAFRDFLSLREESQIHEWFDGFDWKLSERSHTGNSIHAARHLGSVVADDGRKAEGRLIDAFKSASEGLAWLQSYTPEDFGAYFTDNYAHVELIGTRGHFVSDEIAAGFVLYGPHIDYPNHWHVAEEIYIPLTGNGLWSSDNDDYQKRRAGEFIFHESNMPHAIKTDVTPMLAIWIWHGGDLAQKGNY
jgi:hypothetical protein